MTFITLGVFLLGTAAVCTCLIMFQFCKLAICMSPIFVDMRKRVGILPKSLLKGRSDPGEYGDCCEEGKAIYNSGIEDQLKPAKLEWKRWPFKGRHWPRIREISRVNSLGSNRYRGGVEEPRDPLETVEESFRDSLLVEHEADDRGDLRGGSIRGGSIYTNPMADQRYLFAKITGAKRKTSDYGPPAAAASDDFSSLSVPPTTPVNDFERPKPLYDPDLLKGLTNDKAFLLGLTRMPPPFTNRG